MSNDIGGVIDQNMLGNLNKKKKERNEALIFEIIVEILMDELNIDFLNAVEIIKALNIKKCIQIAPDMWLHYNEDQIIDRIIGISVDSFKKRLYQLGLEDIASRIKGGKYG